MLNPINILKWLANSIKSFKEFFNTIAYKSTKNKTKGFLWV